MEAEPEVLWLDMASRHNPGVGMMPERMEGSLLLNTRLL